MVIWITYILTCCVCKKYFHFINFQYGVVIFVGCIDDTNSLIYQFYLIITSLIFCLFCMFSISLNDRDHPLDLFWALVGLNFIAPSTIQSSSVASCPLPFHGICTSNMSATFVLIFIQPGRTIAIVFLSNIHRVTFTFHCSYDSSVNAFWIQT